MKQITLLYPGFKDKALTMSFDDGIDCDIEFVELLKKYDMKSTFNLCSGHFNFTKDGDVLKPGQTCMPLSKNQAKALFSDPHCEVATHGEYHPAYAHIAKSDALYDIIIDRRALEDMFGCLVRGHAYPYGNYDEDVIEMLRLAGIVYARTVESSGNFKIPKNNEWLRWKPTCHQLDEKLDDLIDRFLSDSYWSFDSRLFYIWGHTYEARQIENGWDRIESYMKRLAHRDDVWYATNIEVYDYVTAYRSLIYYADGKTVYNPTQIDIYLDVHNNEAKKILVPAGKTVKFDVE